LPLERDVAINTNFIQKPAPELHKNNSQLMW
jgi:hypothetical protein